MNDHWRVVVERNGEHVVSIEPNMLAGREPSDADEAAIETAARHLIAFIGGPEIPERAEWPRGSFWDMEALDLPRTGTEQECVAACENSGASKGQGDT